MFNLDDQLLIIFLVLKQIIKHMVKTTNYVKYQPSQLINQLISV